MRLCKPHMSSPYIMNSNQNSIPCSFLGFPGEMVLILLLTAYIVIWRLSEMQNKYKKCIVMHAA